MDVSEVENVSSSEGENVLDDASGSSSSEEGESLLLSEMLADDDSTDEFDSVIGAFISSSSSFQPRTKQFLAQIFPPPSDYKSNPPDYKTNVCRTMKVLNNLSGVRMWSPLYIASMAHIQADVTHRQAFLAFRDPEDKVCYLEHKTGKNRDE